MSLPSTASSPSSHPVLSCTDGAAVMWQEFLLLVGRVLLGLVFLIYGWDQILDLAAFAKTFPPRGLAPWMAYVAGPVDLVGGIALVLGIGTRYAALVMLLFTVVAEFSSHAYWSVVPAQHGNQRAHFWKDVSICGGCLLLFVTAGGRYSLDYLLSRKRG